MVLEYMKDDKLSTRIYADYKTRTVKIENYTDDMVDRAFGVNENPTFKDYEEFLEERCFPRTRDKMKLILQDMGLDYYDPLLIIRKTQGRMAEDSMWIRIKEEQAYDNV